MGSTPHLGPQKGAVRVFFGRYDCAIDAKGRLNFPAKFREGMGESFVVMEWLDQCLFALPMAEVERISTRFLELSVPANGIDPKDVSLPRRTFFQIGQIA